MNIDINGETYEVPPEYRDKLINQMWGLVMIEYDKVPQGYKIPVMALTRKLLYDLEKDLAKKHGKETAVKVARPVKGADPTKHLLWVMSGAVREGMKDATICIDTEKAAHSVTALNVSIPSTMPGGGQVAVNGNERERQNNGVETA
jgi:dihydroorotate dehydrogenase